MSKGDTTIDQLMYEVTYTTLVKYFTEDQANVLARCMTVSAATLAKCEASIREGETLTYAGVLELMQALLVTLGTSEEKVREKPVKVWS